MRKERRELLRLQSIIESDRISVNDDFLSLIESDLNKLLRDYFDFSMAPELKLKVENKGYLFTLTLNASRIKQFVNIPKEIFDKI